MTALEHLVRGAEQQLDRYHVPGLQVAVVASGEAVAAAGLGVLGVRDARPVTSRSVFQHGSCGKAYTALLAARLAATGALDLDEPVRRHVPELVLPDPVVAERVTVRDLLAHRSGLGRHDLLWILDGGLTREALVGRLAHLPLGAPFRTAMGYSNLGYALAGLVLERATGRSWEDLLGEHVLGPAGMSASAGTPAQGPDVATGHVLRDGAVVPTAPRAMGAVAPAGLLTTTAEDAARWLLLQCSDDAAVAATHDVAVGMPRAASPTPELQVLGYGLGWVVVSYRGRLGVWHSGGVDGFLTMTLVLPEAGLGVTACANQHMSELPLAVVLSVADGLLQEQGAWYAGPTAAPDAAAGPSGAPPLLALEEHQGRFTDPGYGELRVHAEGAELHATLGATTLPLRHQETGTWLAHYAPLDTSFPLTFVTGASGTVEEVHVPLETGSEPVRFVVGGAT